MSVIPRLLSAAGVSRRGWGGLSAPAINLKSGGTSDETGKLLREGEGFRLSQAVMLLKTCSRSQSVIEG